MGDAGISEDEQSDLLNYNSPYSLFTYTRPTLDDTSRWLREKKGWYVVVNETIDEGWSAWYVTNPNPMVTKLSDNHPDHDTALSEGITLLLKKETDAQ
jgi:hypothetical protein